MTGRRVSLAGISGGAALYFFCFLSLLCLFILLSGLLPSFLFRSLISEEIFSYLCGMRILDHLIYQFQIFLLLLILFFVVLVQPISFSFTFPAKLLRS